MFITLDCAILARYEQSACDVAVLFVLQMFSSFDTASHLSNASVLAYSCVKYRFHISIFKSSIIEIPLMDIYVNIYLMRGGTELDRVGSLEAKYIELWITASDTIRE